MINLFDAAILAIPTAMALHMGIGLVIKYPEWKRNGRTFDRPTASAPAIPDIDLPEPEELLAEVDRLLAKPVPVAPAQAAEIAEPVATLVIPVPEPEGDGLEDLTIRQLKDRARGRVKGFSKMTKATLIDRLRELE